MPAFVLILLASASPAMAHGGHAIAPTELWSAWRPDPIVAALLAVAALAYGRGVTRMWRRAGVGRGIDRRAAALFAGGMAVLVLALLSPLETATGTLLSAHMVQHVLLIAIAPPLLLLGRPDAAIAAALPAAAVSMFRPLAAGLRRLARPIPAASLHAAAIWIWHAPVPFEAALEQPLLHELEHASFLVTALLFWQSLIIAGRSPALLVAAILATLATLVQSGFLGALITLSGRLIYPAYGHPSTWGLTAMEDQQLAGLVMWVPAGALYLAAGLTLGARLIGFDEPELPQVRRERGRAAPPTHAT